MTARQKLAAAELATRKAREHESQAMDALKAAGRINYLGIYSDRWTADGMIATAITHLQDARAAIAAASWPTDADYDAAEREASEDEPPTETAGG